jgi:hypothetical protein
MSPHRVGFSFHSVDDGVANLQHEHDSAGPIRRLNTLAALPQPAPSRERGECSAPNVHISNVQLTVVLLVPKMLI